MLFVATHTHTPDLCPAGNPVAVQQLADAKHVKASGVKVLGSYAAPPEHTFFFVLEAQDYSQVVRYLQPMMKIGEGTITPVQTIGEALGIFPVKGGKGSQSARRPRQATRRARR